MILQSVIDITLMTAQAMMGLAMVLAAWRIIIGPRAQDRILGLDTLYVNALLSIVVFCIRVNSAIYMEAALIIGLLGFTATVALARFLMRGEVIE
ncbi:MAG: K+/H+ antiporter subunit F [Bdellovibrionales bacterium]|jgi:multicomponent K+:H+ antiporter subunit F|nr:K+/H+ antiporter subunit F [Bdellovibrionales bacterium]